MRASAASTGFTIEVTLGDLDLDRASHPRRATWPLVVCGLFALGSACAAFTASPLGQRPAVRPYTEAARAGVVVVEAAVVRIARDVRAL
jgi:hypothetical protein